MRYVVLPPHTDGYIFSREVYTSGIRRSQLEVKFQVIVTIMLAYVILLLISFYWSEVIPQQVGEGGSCMTDTDCQAQFICINRTCARNNTFPTPPPSTPQTSTPMTTTAAPARCPTGFSLFNNRCFMVTRGAFSQPAASAFCIQQGGFLAVLNNPLESFFVSALSQQRGGGPYWVGLRRFGNTWFWMNGTSLAVPTLLNWRPSQPDGCCPPGSVTCALANYQNTAGQLDDAGCDSSTFAGQNFGVACERAAS